MYVSCDCTWDVLTQTSICTTNQQPFCCSFQLSRLQNCKCANACSELPATAAIVLPGHKRPTYPSLGYTHILDGLHKQHLFPSSFFLFFKQEECGNDRQTSWELLSSNTNKEALTKSGKFLEAFIPQFCLEHLPTAFCNSSKETIEYAHSLLFMFPLLPQFDIWVSHMEENCTHNEIKMEWFQPGYYIMVSALPLKLP